MKQVIVMRTDLNMRKGKMVAQGAHASMKALLSEAEFTETVAIIKFEETNKLGGTRDSIRPWLTGIFTKICVGAKSQEEVESIYAAAIAAGLHASLIVDNGITEFNGVPTVTCCCVGPGKKELIDTITGHLTLL